MDYLKKQPIFDVRLTPSKMGIITETLRKRETAKRSLHPSHSVAIIGTKRDWLIQEHQNCLGSWGEGTPYWKICQIKGKILLVGVNQNSNTTLHTVEKVGGAPTLTEETFYPSIIDYEGKIFTVSTRAHIPRRRYLQKIDHICKEKGIMKIGKVGKAIARLIEADKLLEEGTKILKRDKEFFFREKRND